MTNLNELVTADDCKTCRLCCWFTKYDLWETPVITDDLRGYIEENYPDVRFITKDNGGNLFVMTESEQHDEPLSELFDDRRYNCPMLGDCGCILGDKKPFECAIWPFRIMSQNGQWLISISSLCKPACEKSLQSMLDLLDNGLAAEISSFAADNPCIVKNYNDGYPILQYL
jgi:hypothetical protein